MSLSQDPTFSTLKNYFVCGYRDISNEPYAGVSGLHEPDGKAVFTTNGAGPHNIQMFVLSSDGTVLTCLPGFWNSQDLVSELDLAERLNRVWTDPSLSRSQKDALFRQMHLAHIQQHPYREVRMSRMQSFDQQFEAKHRLYSSDTIKDPNLLQAAMRQGVKPLPQEAFKTTDEIFHERMAQRPFVSYSNFDVAAYADYGRPKYDKHEDYRDGNGGIDKVAARSAPQIGNPQANQMGQQGMRNRGMAQTGLAMAGRVFRQAVIRNYRW